MFRERVHKRKPVTTAQQGTLDVHHISKLHEFDDRIRALQEKLQDINSADEVDAGRVGAMEREMGEVERARLDYWESTFDILTKYYRMCDVESQTQEPHPQPRIPQHVPVAASPCGKKMTALPGQRTLLQFCNVNEGSQGASQGASQGPKTFGAASGGSPDIHPTTAGPLAPNTTQSLASSGVVAESSSRAGLLREYMMAVDPTQVKPAKRDRADALACQACQVERIVIEADGVAICPKCNSQDVVLVESDCVAVGADVTNIARHIVFGVKAAAAIFAAIVVVNLNY